MTNEEFRAIQESFKRIQQSLTQVFDTAKIFSAIYQTTQITQIIRDRMKIYNQIGETLAKFHSALISEHFLKQLQEIQERMNTLPHLSIPNLDIPRSELNIISRNISSSVSEEQKIKRLLKEAIKEIQMEAEEERERDRQELNKKKVKGFGRDNN